MRLLDLVDAAWAEALGCSASLLLRPGPHLVRGGPGLSGYRPCTWPALVARCCFTPDHPTGGWLRAVPARPEDVFSAESVKIPGAEGHAVLDPSRHGFVDAAHLQPAQGAAGDRGDPGWNSCAGRPAKTSGRGGFSYLEALPYGLRQNTPIVATGNMTDYRGVLADVGVIGHAPRVPRPYFSPTTGLAHHGRVRAVAHCPSSSLQRRSDEPSVTGRRRLARLCRPRREPRCPPQSRVTAHPQITLLRA